jgi:hypothetical protein
MNDKIKSKLEKVTKSFDGLTEEQTVELFSAIKSHVSAKLIERQNHYEEIANKLQNQIENLK